MKPIKAKIDIEILNIKVDDRYYSFDYIVKLNGIVIQKDNYESDYEDWVKSEFRSYLKHGGALKITLEQLNF